MLILRGFLIILVVLSMSDLCLSQDSLYNKTYSIACHNCYEPQYAKNIEDVFPYTKTIEMDIWDSYWASGGLGSMDSNWYVKHLPWDKGNKNCCGGTFKDCLTRIKSWSDQNPNHDVITVFIDKEENWSNSNETRKPSNLDTLLLSIFSKQKIFTPSDLLKDKKNLKEAVTNWCSVDSLKGKFIFVITDASIQLITRRVPLNEYLEARKNDAVCFVAPGITSEAELIQPKGISQENALNIVFYNLQYQYKNLLDKINSANYLSRLYGSPETKDSYMDLIKLRINFVALHDFKIAKEH